MKKAIFLISLLMGMAACKKSTATGSDSVNNPQLVSIQGKWDLSDIYVSPGGGVDLNAIPWAPVGSSVSDYFWFTDDRSGRFRISGVSTSFNYSINDSTLILSSGNQELILGYKIVKPHLEIYGNLSFDAHCFEFCGSRYVYAAVQ